MSERKPELKSILSTLIESKFLIPCDSFPKGFLCDGPRIKAAWEQEKTMANAFAMGVFLYVDFFREGKTDSQTGKFTPSSKIWARVTDWETEVKKCFSKRKAAGILRDAQFIGNYIEMRNRKAQG